MAQIYIHISFKSLAKCQFLQFLLNILVTLPCFPGQFGLHVPNDIQSPQILIPLDNDALVLLVKDPNSLCDLASEEEVDCLYGIFHLDDLVLPEMDEIPIIGRPDLKPIPLHLPLDLPAEVLKDPSDVPDGDQPLQLREDDEIVHAGVPVLGVFGENALLAVRGELEEEQVFEDADVFFVAVVSRTLVFAFFAIDHLHLLAEAQLLHELFYLAGCGLFGRNRRCLLKGHT